MGRDGYCVRSAGKGERHIIVVESRVQNIHRGWRLRWQHGDGAVKGMEIADVIEIGWVIGGRNGQRDNGAAALCLCTGATVMAGRIGRGADVHWMNARAAHLKNVGGARVQAEIEAVVRIDEWRR